MIQFKKREFLILKYLLEQNKPITAKELAEHFGVSLRMMRYDLAGIELVLNDKKIHLNKKNKVGYWFDNPNEINDLLKKDIGDTKETQWRIYSKDERINKIIQLLLKNNDYITFEDIANELFVSKSTIKRDIVDVENWFNERKVKIIKIPNNGIKISCNEKSRRNAMKDFIEDNNGTDLTYIFAREIYNKNSETENDSFVNNFVDSLYKEVNPKPFAKIIINIGRKLGVTYSDQAINNLIIHFGIARNRLMSNDTIKMNKDKLNELKDTLEYNYLLEERSNLEELYNVKIPDSEIGFMSLHLIGAKIAKIEEDIDTEPNDDEEKIVNDYIQDVSNYLGIDLTHDEILRKNLWIHIKPTLFRLKNGLKIVNPILTQIKEKYPNIYKASRNSADKMQRVLNVTIKDDEVGFMAMHIGASLERIKNSKKKKIRVLVACGTSFGTAKILSSRLEREFDEFEIVDEVTVYDIKNHISNNIDLVISTVPIPDIVLTPTIVVSPLLNRNDVLKIQEAIGKIENIVIDEYDNRELVDNLIGIIEQFAKIRDTKGLRCALKMAIENYRHDEEMEVRKLLSEMISEETIEIGNCSSTKNDAIRAAGNLLVNSGHIKESYVDGMIELADELNAYIVIAPGIAMPHARPDKGAIKSGFGIMTLKNPIAFGHPVNDPVKMVIPLAASDNSSHLRALSELASLLDDEKNIEALVNAKTKQEIIEVINNFEKEFLVNEKNQ